MPLLDSNADRPPRTPICLSYKSVMKQTSATTVQMVIGPRKKTPKRWSEATLTEMRVKLTQLRKKRKLILWSLNRPNFNLFNLPVFLAARQEQLGVHLGRTLVHVAKHRVAVPEVLERNKQVWNICFTERGGVIRLVLLDRVVSLWLAHRALDWLPLLAISHGEEVGFGSVSVRKVTDPAEWIVTTKDVAVVSLDEN